MRTYQQTVREGEDMGPIDWSHPMAAGKPEHWREAERNPEGFELLLNGMFTPRRIAKLCMYDGWPYWKPTPAILRESPMGGFEWTHFNSYGVTDNSIRPIALVDEAQSSREMSEMKLPEGYELYRDDDGDWVLSPPDAVTIVSVPGEGLLIGQCDRATAESDAIEYLDAIDKAEGRS